MVKVVKAFAIDSSPLPLVEAINAVVETARHLDDSATNRQTILEDILSPGKSARLALYIDQADITKTYGKPGGHKKMAELLLETDEDIKIIANALRAGLKAGGPLQLVELKNGRMPLGALTNESTNRVVLLNVPKSLLRFDPATVTFAQREKIRSVLENLISHDHYVAILNHALAKRGIKESSTRVEDLLDDFNMEAITGYKDPAARIAAIQEWKSARNDKASRVTSDQKGGTSSDTPAHELRDWIEEFRFENGLPKTTAAAKNFFRRFKQKLAEIAPDNKELQYRARDAAIKMVKDSALIGHLATGDIEGYMEIINRRDAERPAERPAKRPAERPDAASAAEVKLPEINSPKKFADAIKKAFNITNPAQIPGILKSIENHLSQSSA